MLSTAAQDGTPAAEAAQVVGELPDISVAETTGGTLNMGVSFDATNFDPTQTQDNMSLWVEMQIFSRLVRVNNVGTDLEGDLAESWDISEDGTEYTFHLRPDAMFGDGSPVTADDVVFSFERAMGDESLIGWTFEAVESVEAAAPAGSGKGTTLNSCSLVRRSGSRLVTSMVRRGHAASSCAKWSAASITCSTLSSTRRRRVVASRSIRSSRTLRCPDSLTPRAWAMAGRTRFTERIASSETNATPSGNCAAIDAAT